jgi:hypothetical protein
MGGGRNEWNARDERNGRYERNGMEKMWEGGRGGTDGTGRERMAGGNGCGWVRRQER